MVTKATFRVMAVAVMVVLIGIGSVQAYGNVLVSDDFESGTLNQWTIGGRRLGVNVAEVVTKHGSLMGHLRHSDDYTEITLERTFVYNPDINFTFDLEVDARSSNSSTDDDYAHGGVRFAFMNAAEDVIGWVWYISSTSSWPFNEYRPENRNEAFAANIGDGSLSSHNLNAGEALSNLNIDHDAVVSFKFEFLAYNSGSAGTMSSDVWVDNVTISQSILTNLEIVGADECAEDSQGQYRAIAHYDIGSPEDVTASTQWSVEPNDDCGIAAGLLATEMIDLPTDVIIAAQYSEGGNIQEAQKQVSILAICPYGSALEFDGHGDYVNCGDDESLDITDEITISAWIKRPSFNADGMVVGKNNGNSVTAGYALISYRQGLEFSFYSSQEWQRTIPRVAVTANQWHHVAGTFNGNMAYLYVDGEQRASLAYVGNITIDAGYPVQIAYWRSQLPAYFNGSIDDVAIYDRALSAEEIRMLRYDRPDTDDPSLVGYWDFDEGEGQIAGDSAGGNDGTVIGATWTDSIPRVGICSVEGIVERNLLNVLGMKSDVLDILDEAIGKEQALWEYMDEVFKDRNFGSAKKGDVVKAKQKIMSAIQQEEQAETAVDQSIGKLDDALNTLGIE